jgi:hypothetical protein
MLFNLENWQSLLTNPVVLVVTLFQIWMFVHAVRNHEWVWAVFIFIFWGLTAVLYYFLVYRQTPSSTRGFELPGAYDRKRIKELQAQIHHLDKAHHYSKLGDIYFQQGKLEEAEKCYRSAMERDAEDLDTRAHLGQCLLRTKRAAEARPLLEGVIATKPDHEYGYTLMALAETLTALGETDNAMRIWQQVIASHSYPRATVQLKDLARAELKDVLSDDVHAPTFQRKRDRVWINQARSLMGKL